MEPAQVEEQIRRDHELGTTPRRTLSRVGTAALAGGALLWKFKAALLFVLTKLKALLVLAKLGKVLTTGGSMLISVWAYAGIHGWPYGVGFVLLILVHEMGHYVAARRLGLDVGAPVFIPFFGAFIAMREMPKDARVEAIVGIAGPLLGSAAALLCYVAALATGSDLFMALAYVGFFLNLFNLIPLLPFDGGRVVGAISPRLWLLGLPLLLGVFFTSGNALLLILAALALPRFLAAFRKGAGDDPYYQTAREHRWAIGSSYLALVAVLALLLMASHRPTGLGG
jgi:Zn-dependent protease